MRADEGIGPFLQVELLMSPKDYNVYFAPTKFSPEGIFDTRKGVTVPHPERSIERIRLGLLAGNISNRQDSAGNPRLITGFASALFIEEDGSASCISGIFNALSEDFRASAQDQGRQSEARRGDCAGMSG